MPVKREKALGTLQINKLPKNLCWGTPEEFVKKLIEILGVNIVTHEGSNFVIVSHVVPPPEDKGKLWVRTTSGGVFQGFFLFQDSTWQRIQNRRSDEVIWLYGDSRELPEGFQLIEPGIGGIASDVVDFIVTKYLKDPAASTPTQTVYKYFAVRWIGAT